ncbi:MAG: methyltransferase domain-containing protein [Candidatus Magasanikbacteria bacterium]|jgi:methionine biosynthesis protein MetW|nr:methyltransferase domain-containing protein [Candidatus Magasanikbacteria bacterium]
MIKKLFWKIKEDLKKIFYYPVCSFGPNLSQDHKGYWKLRRTGDAPVLSHWQKQRADFVLGLIKPNSTVLDIGCGDGAVLQYLKDNAGVYGIGADIDDKSVELVRSLGLEAIKMDVTDLNRLNELPEVDYITGFEVIEHMPNPEQFIYLLKEKAREGFIFSVPNTGYYTHRLRMLFGMFPLQWIAHPGEHLRFWTVRDVKFWVKSVGFEMKNLILYEGLPILNKIWPSMYAQGIIIHIKNKD